MNDGAQTRLYVYNQSLNDTTIENLGLSCVALEKGLDVSDQDLANEIRNAMPSLVDAKGVFNKQAYEMQLQRMGFTIPMFEERMKQQILLKRMQDLSSEGIFVLTQCGKFGGWVD